MLNLCLLTYLFVLNDTICLGQAFFIVYFMLPVASVVYRCSFFVEAL